MAVYEQGYQRWSGTLTSPAWRFLVIAKFSLKEIFKNRFFRKLFHLLFVYPIICLALIYVWHNLDFLKQFGNIRVDIPLIDAQFYFAFVVVQGFLGFIVTLLVGPELISKELINNALPLYLSRPISRFDYIMGKLMVLIFLLSVITWVPGIIIFLFDISLSEESISMEKMGTLGALVASSWIVILIMSVPMLTICSYIKKKHAARGAYIGIIFISSGFGEAINNMFRTDYGNLIRIPALTMITISELFGIDLRGSPGVLMYITLVCVFLFCLYLVYRRIRPVEVVR
jgi:ABC-type transport system involved in multi-copper enzyme maturation permease subunit